MKRLLLPLILALLTTPSFLAAQQPADWQTLSPEAFTGEVATLLAAEPAPTDETVRAVVEHAWNTILTDSEQIASGEWTTIEALARRIVPHRDLLVTGLPEAERTAAQAQLDRDLTTLNARLKARLLAEESLVAGVPINAWYDRQVALVGSGMSRADRVELCHLWKHSNAWASSRVDQLAWLVAALNQDEVNRERFSVRWTGRLIPPQTGSYTFAQLSHRLVNGTMQVSIDGKVVLNHRHAPPSTEVDPALYRSAPVELVAAEPVTIEVEYVFDRGDKINTPWNEHREYPMAVLQWESNQLDQQPVPASAYQTLGGEPGLTGEYFNDVAFTQAVGTRVDPSVQFVYSGRTIYSRYASDQDEVVNAVVADLIQRLSQAPAEERAQGLIEFCGWILPHLSANQRLRFLSDLADQPQLIKDLSPAGMALVFSHTAMLSTEDHLDLMGMWGESHLPPPCQPGRYPDDSANGYVALNYTAFDSFATLMSDGLWDHAEYLIKNYLIREDGACNVPVVYCLATAARYERKGSRLCQAISEQLADETLTGDQRASWLLARKFVAEVCVDYPLNPRFGMEYLEEATLVAESPALTCRLLCEQATKLMSLDREEEALELLDLASQSATSPEEQSEIARLRTVAPELTAYYAQRRIDSVQQQAAAAAQAYLAEMRRSEEQARERGDDSQAQVYANRISTLEAAIKAREDKARK